MYINYLFRNVLLDPALAGTLAIPSDRFVLRDKDLRFEIKAHLLCPSECQGFILEFSDYDGRDISEFFERKSNRSRVCSENTVRVISSLAQFKTSASKAAMANTRNGVDSTGPSLTARGSPATSSASSTSFNPFSPPVALSATPAFRRLSHLLKHHPVLQCSQLKLIKRF